MGANDYAAILGSVAALIVAIGGLGIIQGRKEAKAQPTDTMKAIEAIVARANCSAPALSNDIAALKHGQAELSREHSALQRDLDQIRDVVTRIEDRTKRG